MRVRRNVRRGHLRVAITASIFIAILTAIFLGMRWLRVGGPPIDVTGTDVVMADITDYESFSAVVNNDPYGSIIATKSNKNGNYLLVKMAVLQSFIDEHRTELVNYIAPADIRLEGEGLSLVPLLLNFGIQEEFDDGSQRSTFPELVVFQKSDGQFEVSERKSSDPEKDIVGMVKGLNKMSSMSGGSKQLGIRDWARAHIDERIADIGPPAVHGHIFMYEANHESDMAWSRVEFACLFRLPSKTGSFKLTMFNDVEAAVPVTVSDSTGPATGTASGVQFDDFAAREGVVKCQKPVGWEVVSGGSAGVTRASFTSGSTKIVITADIAGSAMTDLATLGGEAGEETAIEIHEVGKAQAEDDFRNYEEEDGAILDTRMGIGYRTNFTSTGLLGGVTRGVRATILGNKHRVILIFSTPESSWDSMLPVFDTVLKSIHR